MKRFGLWWYTIVVLTSCTVERRTTAAIGFVIEVDANSVLVAFPVVTGRGEYGQNWFWYEEHSYKKGDVWP